MRNVVYSAVQSSGSLHLGNYLGAISRWKALQDEGEAQCVFGIADLHAMTTMKGSRDRSLACAREIMACGIDGEKSLLYRQGSLGGYHTQLMWLLSTVTPVGWLSRMIQYKEKAKLDPSNNTAALFTYPLLQAADVLLFHATRVPVGQDQTQHLELVKDTAQAFNQRYDTTFFPLPLADISGDSARIMSLKDASVKMSKSSGSSNSLIYVADTAEEIEAKIKRATTDSGKGISFDVEKRAELSNLIRIFAALEGSDVLTVAQKYEHCEKAQFKRDLTEVIVTHLAPVRKYIEKTSLQDTAALLDEAEKKAERFIGPKWTELRQLTGL